MVRASFFLVFLFCSFLCHCHVYYVLQWIRYTIEFVSTFLFSIYFLCCFPSTRKSHQKVIRRKQTNNNSNSSSSSIKNMANLNRILCFCFGNKSGFVFQVVHPLVYIQQKMDLLIFIRISIVCLFIYLFHR